MKIENLELALEAGIPVLIWGPPGVGKTSAIRALCKARGWHLETVIASIREPADFLGLPVIRDGTTHFSPPEWAVRLAHSNRRAILFIDEISTAPPAVQAALLRVVLERVVGELELPETVRVVAAANPPELAAGGWELSPPLANRFVHLTWETDPTSWVQGFSEGFPAPKPLGVTPMAIEAQATRAKALVAGFIRRKPRALYESPREGVLAFATPRTWEFAARLLAANFAANRQIEEALPLVAGAVGEGLATEFIVWVREADLPDPAQVLADPNYPLPDRGDIAFSLLSSVVQYAIQHKDQYIAAWRLLARAANEGKADIAAVAASALVRARPTGVEIPKEYIAPFTSMIKAINLA